jgi:hypothetical protein
VLTSEWDVDINGLGLERALQVRRAFNELPGDGAA